MDEFTEDQKRQLEDLIIDLEAKGLTQEEIQSQIDIKKLEFLNLEKEQTPQKEEDATVELDVASTDTDFNLEDTSSDLLNENPFYTVTAEDLNKSEEQAVPALNKILAASGIFLEQSTAFGNSDAVNLRNYNDIDKNAGGLKEGDLRRSISDASLNLIGNPIDIFTSVGIGKDLTPEERQEAADKINEYIKENGNSNHIKEARERNFDTWKEYAKFIEAPEIEEKELIKAYKEDLLSSFNQVLAKENPNTEILNTDGFPSAQLPVEAVAATIEDFANQEQFDDYKEWKENNYIKDPSEQSLIQYDAERKEKYALDESVSFANDLNSKDRLDVLAIAADEAATTRDFVTEFNDFNKTKDTFDQSLEQYKTNPTPENYITASTIQLEYLKELGEIQDLQDKLNKQGVLDRSQAVPLALQDFHKDYNRLRQLRSVFKRLGTGLGFATAQLATLAGSRSNPIALGSYLTKPSLLNKDIESSTGLVSLGQEMQDETNNFQRAIEVDRIKNLSDAGRWTAGATVNLIPSLSMAFTGGAAMPLFFLSGYGSKGMETAINQKVASERLIANRNFLDENPNIDFFKKMAIESEMKKDAEVLNLNGWETLGVQALYGIAEVVFEKLGTMTLLNNIKKGIKMLPPKTIKEGAAFVGKQLAKGGIREGGSEFGTTFTQNLVDITILGEDKNVFEGGLESFSQGFLMGGGMNMVNVSKGLRQSLVSFTASKEELTILQSKLLEIRNLTGRKDLESWTQLEDGIKRKRLKKPVQNQVDRLVNEMKTIEDGVLFKLGTTLSKKQAIAVDEKGRLMRAINKQFIQAVSDLRNSPSELAAVEKSLKAEFEKLENEREALLNNKVGQEQTKKSYTNSQLSEISNSGYQLYDMRMLNESITGIVADYNNLSPEAILEFDEKAKLELGENASVDQIKDRAMNIYVDESYRQRIMVGMRNSVDFSVQQGLNIDFQSFSGENSKQETITALENIGVINNSKKGKEARRLVEKGLFEGWSGKVDGVNTVIVDVESAVKNRRIGIFAHEILHVYANERYGDDVDSAGENLLNYLEQNQPDVFAKVKYRIDQSYTKKDADGKVVKEKDYYKEAMNAMSDVLADGQNLKGDALNSLRLFANSFLTELPSALKFSVDQSQEAFQFVKNYNKDSHMGGASANTKGKVIVTFPPKRMSITNTGNAVKVINTVYEGVKNAIANNENIKSIKFTSDFSEKSRTRLYKSIAEKVSKELNWNLDIYEDAFDFDGEREITSTEYTLSKKTSSKKLKNNKNSLQFRKKPKTEGYQKAVSDGMPIGAGKEGFTSSFEVNGKKYSVYLAQVSYDGVNIDGQYELSFSLVDEANKQLSVPMVNNLSTQEFSKQFSYLKDVGAEFDFSEFNKVENKRTKNPAVITSENLKTYNQSGSFSYTTPEGRKIDDLVGGKDKDGNYIMTKAEWDAGGIKDAYNEVNKSDGLFQPTIRKGIQGDEIQGISRSEFDDNVKFKIVEILMKFNPEKNNSLSGYVNSLAFFKKGDALKEAKKTPTGRSLDTPAGEVGSVQEIGAEDDVDFDTIIGYDAGTEIAEKKGKKVKTELNLSKEETKSIEDNIDKTFSELKEDDFSFKKLPNLAAATIAEKLGVRTSRITETSGNDLNSREFNILQSFIKTNVSLFNQLLPEGYIGPDAAVSEGLKNTATKVPNRLEQNLKLYTPDGNKYVRNDNISDIDILESIGIVDGKIVNSNPRGPVARQIKGFMSLMTRTATNQFVREKLYKLKQSPDVVRKIADTEAGKGIGMFSKSLDDAKNKAAKENNDKLPAEFKLAKGASNERVLERLAQIDDENNEARKDYFASKPLSKEFNEILENKKGIAAAAKEKVYEKAVASLMGKKLDKRFSSMLSGMYLGNNANDFLGLLYKTLGKKQVGNKQLAWIKTNLLNPYAVAMNNITDSRAALFRDYNTLKSKLKIVPKTLEKTIPDMAFTNSHAVRVYIWNKQGFSVPEISERDKRDLVAIVRDDPKLKLFAEQLVYINKQTKYPEAEKGWQSGNITTDLQNSINQNKRAKYLEQWQENVDTIFSEKNLNKLEVLYGTKYREAIEGTLSRMKTGRNKNMEQGKPELLYNRFVNGAIGNVMFFNTKSALLQTISLANFVNLTDNNVLAASKAFANQPQFWKDFSKLFNSNYLKERRGDLKMNVNEADLAAIAKKDGLKGVFAKLLQIGFLPTQLADSFAIASGGATFYRNRVKSLLKQTNSDGKKIYTEKQAQDKAFLDFREIAEESQQSSRPDKISQEQASTLGRTILAFANAPAQYARIIQKAASDLKNGRGDRATNVSRILYYGFVQNVIFNFLQQGLFSLAFGDDEELTGKEETKIINVANGMLDSLLRGSGIFGAIAATAKNVGVEFYKQYNKPYGSFNPSKFLEAAVSFSPPMQTKIRKVNKFSRNLKWDREEIDKASNQLKNKEFQKFLNNPALEAGAMAISATTNIPIDRLINKTINVTDALTRDLERWQQVSLLLGYDKWLLNIDEPKQKKINYKTSKSKQKNYY